MRVDGAGVVRWLESLASPAGDRPLALMPFQRRFVRLALGHEVSALSTGAGNGGSTLGAALSACALVGPLAEQGGEVVIAAASFARAQETFRLALGLLAPALAEYPHSFRTVDTTREARLVDLASGSTLRAAGCDQRRLAIPPATFAVADDPDLWPDADGDRLHEELLLAIGKRRGRLVAIGPRPDNPGHWFNLVEAVQLHAARLDLDPFTARAIHPANPARTGLPQLAVTLRRLLSLARGGSADRLATWRRRHLNLGPDAGAVELEPVDPAAPAAAARAITVDEDVELCRPEWPAKWDGAIAARALGEFLPPVAMLPSVWAEQNLRVTVGPRAPGRWYCLPYQREILDVFDTEPHVRTVVVMAAAQTGKSAAFNTLVGYHVAMDPTDILIVARSEDMVTQEVNMRLRPMLLDTPAIRDKLDRKHARTAETRRNWDFVAGSIRFGYAGSAASLSSRSVRVLLLDEVDRYPQRVGREGDPISTALVRTDAYYATRRVAIVSSCTTEDAPVAQWHDRGDRREFHVPCAGCGELWVFRWSHVKWKPGKTGARDGDPETARLVCPSCGYEHTEPERLTAIELGRWIPTAEPEDKSIVSFWLPGLCSPFVPLAEGVRRFQAAIRARDEKYDPEPYHAWRGTYAAEPRPADDAPEAAMPADVFLDRAEVYPTPCPAGVVWITMGVDVQDDRLEALVTGWGVHHETWLLAHRVFPGETDLPPDEGPWAELGGLLEATYARPDGKDLPIRLTAVDTGGHRTMQAYRFVERHGAQRVIAIKGLAKADEGEHEPICGPRTPPEARARGAHRRRCGLHMVNTWRAKSVLLATAAVSEPGPRYMHVPQAPWMTRELASQIVASEQLRQVAMKNGVRKLEWVKLRQRNEGLDMLVYAYAAMHAMGGPSTLTASVRPKPKPAPAEKAKPAPPRRRRGGPRLRPDRLRLRQGRRKP